MSIETKNKNREYRINTISGSCPILKLHGSFNWKKDYPVIVTNQDNLKERDVFWIPPGLDKKREQYPFNLLWARAKEILKCDILRIIGCSLNRNDMQLISLVFGMQKINSSRKFKIEIIQRPFLKKTQTALYGDSEKKPGEVDLILRPSAL